MDAIHNQYTIESVVRLTEGGVASKLLGKNMYIVRIRKEGQQIARIVNEDELEELKRSNMRESAGFGHDF